MRYFKRWQFALVCLVALALIPFVPARRGHTQATTYTVTDLGTLASDERSAAYGIDNCGRVVGGSYLNQGDLSPRRPFFWNGGTMTDMGTLGGNSGAAFGININASVAGYASNANNDLHAFIWSNATNTKTDIGTLPGGEFSAAFDINDANTVVGQSEIAPLKDRGFIWTQAAGMQSITPFDPNGSSIAYGINNAGQVVGSATSVSGLIHGFFRAADGTMTDMGTLGGTTSTAFEVNEAGQAVGYSFLPANSANAPSHGILWTANTGLIDMGTLDGALHSIAYDINNAGQAVGWSESANGRRAFIWTQATGMTDLNTLVAPDSNWTLQQARSINDRGQIAGFGINPDGKTHAFLLTPDNVAPPPCAQTLQFSSATYSVSESGTKATITVTRTGGTAGAVSVSYATSDGTATTADNDYTPASGTLNFADGDTQKTFDVSVTNDSVVEPDETVNLALSNPTGGVTLGTPSTAVLTITNDDVAPVNGTLQFSKATYDVAENGGTATIIVTRTGGSDGAVSVDFATVAGGTATAGQDYTSNSGTLNWANGDASDKTFTVAIINDALDEADETVNLALSNPTGGATIGAQSTTTLTITDNDPPPSFSISNVDVSEGNSGTTNAVFNVMLSAASGKTVTIDFATADDSATVADGDYNAASGTLTFAPGETSKPITVQVNGDTKFEATEKFFVNLSNVQNAIGSTLQVFGQILNDDEGPTFSINDVTLVEGNAGTTSFNFTVTKTGSTALASTVNFSTADGTAQDHNPASEDSDYQATSGTLNFAPADTSKTVTVLVNADSTPEANETFFVNLSAATGASVADSQGQGTITNDDAALSISDAAAVLEGDSGTVNAVFTVSIPFATVNTVTVNFSTADGTATVAGGDYNSNSGTLTFNPGDTSKPVTVQVKGDTLDEPDENFFVNLSSATNASIADAQGQGTITDDDDAPSLSISDSTVTEGDSGTTDAVFNVSLSAPSGKTVTVGFQTVQVSDLFDRSPATAGSDYISTSGTLTFIPGDTSESIIVKVLGDTVNEPNEVFAVVLLNPPTNATLANSSAVGTIMNDDTPRLQFSQAVYQADESLHFKVVTVTRTGDASLPVTVDYVSSDGTASERNDYTFAFGTLRFAAGETSKDFDVLITDDGFFEQGETFSLTLSNPTGGAALGSQSTATVTIIANDETFSGPNPIGDTENFVRQHYHDFFGRKPDDAGLAFWKNGIDSCGSNSQCRDVKRIDTSAAFFLSIEFQNTGYLVERMYKAAYGDAVGVTRITGAPVQISVPIIRRQEFLVDSALIRNGLVVGVGDWEKVLEDNKNRFALTFVQRQRFTDAYPATMTPAAFVAKLNQNTGGALTQSEADALAAEFGGAANTSDVSKRASVVRKVAENAEVDRREKNRAFVLMQYFGYLRRDPDAAPDSDHTGWKFWLDKLDQFGGDFRRAEMVKAFITSNEYRGRFGGVFIP